MSGRETGADCRTFPRSKQVDGTARRLERLLGVTGEQMCGAQIGQSQYLEAGLRHRSHTAQGAREERHRCGAVALQISHHAGQPVHAQRPEPSAINARQGAACFELAEIHARHFGIAREAGVAGHDRQRIHHVGVVVEAPPHFH